MAELPEPLRSVLRDYCHVEWFDVDELAADVRTGRQAFDVDALRTQLRSLVDAGADAGEITRLTAHEFTSSGEATAWLGEIYATVFP